MPRLVHKTKVERQKNWNYTERHDKLQKNLRSGKIYATKKEVMIDAGYSQTDSVDNMSGAQKLLHEWKLPEIAVGNFKRAATIEEDADRDTRENVALKVRASELILKMSGDMKERSETEHKGKVEIVNTTKNAITSILDRISGNS